ncbi:MAG: 6-bladed beta-propeller [Gemmatimonadetes bacterium]|nr:6-bladed beta-propeller [Gemmatimonadota bacterium]
MRSSGASIRQLALPLLAWVLALAAGCSRQGSAGVKFEAVAVAEPPLVWPTAPAAPRIRHLANVATPGDVGARGTWFSRMVRVFTGGVEPRVRRPHGIAVDTAGRVFVADVALRGVHVFDPVNGQYRFLTTTGKRGFQSPVGVALDAVGNVYVSDSELGEVVVFDAAGKERRRIREGLERPTGLAYDRRSALLYVADTKGHRIAVFDSTGRPRASIGSRGTGEGEFNFPTNVAMAPDGSLLVTDAMNFRVQVFSPDGKFLRQFGHNGDAPGSMPRPKGVALDSEGHVYVVDGLFDVINVYDASGRLLLTFGGAGHGRGEFWLASGIAIDRQDRVYVSDSYNGRIQVLQYLAEVR